MSEDLYNAVKNTSGREIAPEDARKIGDAFKKTFMAFYNIGANIRTAFEQADAIVSIASQEE